MPNVKITAETETWIVREADPDDRWDSGDSSGRVSTVKAELTDEPADRPGAGYTELVKALDVKVGDTVYALVADYESGDTFGRSGGHYQIIDVFATTAEADELMRIVDSFNSLDGRKIDKLSTGFEFQGVRYFPGWVGHFESLNIVAVWECEVWPLKGSSEHRRARYRKGR